MKKELTHDQVNQPGLNDKIFFYQKEFYAFDNFSAFTIEYDGVIFSTSEHAYQATKFKNTCPKTYNLIRKAKSAHEAKKIAEKNKEKIDSNWDNCKTSIMKEILRNKIEQHPYVLKKLIQSGDREIIEDSWRDSVWGWGKNKDGQNLLGKLWMQLREEYKK